MKIQPVGFKWLEIDLVDPETGEVRKQMAMVPHERFRFVCRRQFEPGQDYSLVSHEARSTKSHAFFFACVNEAFINLPENIAARFPSAEHLRSWALIETGFYDEKQFDYEGPNAKRYAHMLAAHLRVEDAYSRISMHQISKGHHPNEYSDAPIVDVKRSGSKWIVIVRKAKSQSYAAMNKEEFEASKRAVLDLLENMTNVPRGTLQRETNRHA